MEGLQCQTSSGPSHIINLGAQKGLDRLLGALRSSKKLSKVAKATHRAINSPLARPVLLAHSHSRFLRFSLMKLLGFSRG